MGLSTSIPHVYVLGGAVLVLALAVKLLTVVVRVVNSPLSQIPGPWYTKWTKLVLTRQLLKGTRSDYVNALHETYGPIVRIAPDYVAVADIASVKRIHTVKADFVKSKFYDVFSQGNYNVFNTRDVHVHRQRRRLLSGPMAESNLKTMLPIIDGRVRQTMERMGEEMRKREAVDVFKWWMFMATDIIGELTFGESFRMLDLGKKNQYVADLEDAGKKTSLESSFTFLTGLARKGWKIPLITAAVERRQRMLIYATESIARYKRQLLVEPDNPKPTLFTKLFNRKDGEGLNDSAIRNEAAVYIIAGSDTTANTLTYLTWAVCQRPDLKRELVGELFKLPDNFEEKDLVGLPLMNNIIEEALRLYPAVPALLPRVTPPEGVNFGGYWIPGGTIVGTQSWTLHRDPQVFPNPLEFDPSRWEAPTQAMKDAFMPFGGGSRICIGLHLARIELRLAVARFFRTFPNSTVSTREGMNDRDMDPMQFFLIKPAGTRCLINAC